MIQLFNLSVINHINGTFDDGTECYLQCGNDAQNAIAYEHKEGYIYWCMCVDENLVTFKLVEVMLDKEMNVVADFTHECKTVQGMINHIRFNMEALK